MDNLNIVNNEQFSKWAEERRKLGHAMIAIKGKAPDGAKYSDGDPIEMPVNVAWMDGITGEVFALEYQVEL